MILYTPAVDSVRTLDKETMRRLSSLERKFQSYVSMRGQEGQGSASPQTGGMREWPGVVSDLLSTVNTWLRFTLKTSGPVETVFQGLNLYYFIILVCSFSTA